MEEKEFDTPAAGGSAAPQQGRRLDPNAKGGKGKLILIIVTIVVAVALVAYLALCGYATARHRTLPNTVTRSGVDISGLTPQKAAEVISNAADQHYETLEIPISVNGKTVILHGKDAQPTMDQADVEARVSWWKDTNFVVAGWRYLSSLFGSQNVVDCPATIQNENYVNQILDEADALAGDSVTEASWTVEETEDAASLVLTKGITGQGVDREALRGLVMNELCQGLSEPINVAITTTAPQMPDFDRMAEEVRREPINATLDVEADEVIPHQLGLALDTAKAKEVYDTLAEGESGRVELEVTQPEVTTLELRATLFHDILGEGTSKITGDAARVNNVILAARACDGVVLLPGQKMSYNQTTGQRTTAKGYREATGYTSKGQEMMVGGGVCQPSSTLYLACLTANLEIVERKNHMYTVSYMPEGIDATVSWPNLDYVFANNTKYPIKVSMTIENRVLTARIYGTKTDDNYVKMESVRLSTTPAGVSYQADPEIPRGTTTVVQGSHTGKKVEVYKNTYAGDGTLISRQWVSTDTYRPSDKIIGYNPLDGVPGVIDPVAPGDVPAIVPTDPPADPAVTPAPPPVVPEVTPTPPPVEPSPTPSAPPVVPEVIPSPPPVDVALMPSQPADGIPLD